MTSYLKPYKTSSCPTERDFDLKSIIDSQSANILLSPVCSTLTVKALVILVIVVVTGGRCSSCVKSTNLEENFDLNSI